MKEKITGEAGEITEEKRLLAMMAAIIYTRGGNANEGTAVKAARDIFNQL